MQWFFPRDARQYTFDWPIAFLRTCPVIPFPGRALDVSITCSYDQDGSSLLQRQALDHEGVA